MKAKKPTEKITKDKKLPIDLLDKTTKKLLSLMMVDSKADISEDPENDAYIVNINGEGESGLLIGARGRTLISLQTLLGLMLRQNIGEWKRVIVNISDWREKEEERLKGLALQSSRRAKETGEPQYLYNLSSSQRRIVHMCLSEDDEINTESQGEGNDRFLIISPKG